MIFDDAKVVFSCGEWKALAEFSGDERGPYGFHIDIEARMLVCASFCALLSVKIPEGAPIFPLAVRGIQAKQIAKRMVNFVQVWGVGHIQCIGKKALPVVPLEPFEASHHLQGASLTRLLELPGNAPTPVGSFDFDILSRISTITSGFGGSKCRFHYPHEPLGELHVLGLSDTLGEVWHAVLMPLRDPEAQAAYDRREQAEIRQNGHARLEADKNRVLCCMSRKDFNLLVNLPAKPSALNAQFIKHFHDDVQAITFHTGKGEWERTLFGDQLVASYRQNGWAK